LQRADLVLGMERAHVRHSVLLEPEAWPRAFTLKELVRRGAELGPRPPVESPGAWLARAHEGRDRPDLLGDSPLDDVADPYGGPSSAYEAGRNRDRRPSRSPRIPPLAHKWRSAPTTGNIWRSGSALMRLSIDIADIEAFATTRIWRPA
jgi:hypothetical protein